MDVVTESAPAQSEASPAPVLTAAHAAVANNDVPAFREARRAERSGTPVPAPVAAETPAESTPAAPAPPVEEPRTVSKRQQQINDYERRIAAQEQRIRALEAGPATPPASEASRPAPAPGETFPPYAQYLESHPDASLEDYIDARQDFRDDRKARTTQAQRLEAEQTRTHQESIEQARARVAAAVAADPQFETKLSPELLAIPTREAAIANRQIPRAENDFATEIAKSEYLPQILLHVSEHPDLLETIRGLDTRRAVLKFVAKLETRFEKAADTAPVIPVPKTVSSAPAPGTTLGSQPASQVDAVNAAVRSGDVPAFRAAKRAREQARR